jgi:predicted N-acetyltransferase YhbS
MTIESLNEEHLKRPFTTTESETTSFWYERALDEHKKWRCGSTKVLVGDSGEILGYYTLAMQTISLSYGPSGHPQDRKVAAVLLGQLAVNAPYEGQGHSRTLFKGSISDIISVARLIGVYVVVVDSVNESKVSFWEKFGFKRFAADRLRFVYPVQNLLPMV